MNNDHVSPSSLASWQASSGEGKLQVTLTIYDTGKGISAILTGGDEPHVGGVVLALPRPSLAQTNKYSADTYSIPIPGHKDVEVASIVANKIAVELKQPVAISAGIHSDNLTSDQIKQIIDFSQRLAQSFLTWYRNKNSERS